MADRRKVKLTDLENVSPMEPLYPADPEWLAEYFDTMADTSAELRRMPEYRNDCDRLRVFGHFARSIASRLRALAVLEDDMQDVVCGELYEVTTPEAWRIVEGVVANEDEDGNLLSLDVTADVDEDGDDDFPPEMWPPGAP